MTQITYITVTSFKKLHQTSKNILLVKFTQRYMPTWKTLLPFLDVFPLYFNSINTEESHNCWENAGASLYFVNLSIQS